MIIKKFIIFQNHLKFNGNLSSLKIGKQKWKPWPELLLLFTSLGVVVVPLIFSFSCMAEVWSHFMDFVFPSKNSTSWITLVGKWVTSRGFLVQSGKMTLFYKHAKIIKKIPQPQMNYCEKKGLDFYCEFISELFFVGIFLVLNKKLTLFPFALRQVV